jgi:hypothetical protein
MSLNFIKIKIENTFKMKLTVAFLLGSFWLSQAHALKATNGVLPRSPSAHKLYEHFSELQPIFFKSDVLTTT